MNNNTVDTTSNNTTTVTFDSKLWEELLGYITGLCDHTKEMHLGVQGGDFDLYTTAYQEVAHTSEMTRLTLDNIIHDMIVVQDTAEYETEDHNHFDPDFRYIQQPKIKHLNREGGYL